MRKLLSRSLLLALVTLILAACSSVGGIPIDESTSREPEAFAVNLGIRTGSDTAQQFLGLDDTETDSFKVTVSGNVNDFEPTTEAMSAQSTSITIEQLRAIVNGSVYVLEYDEFGEFETELPIDPGSNTIQLQILDQAGDYYTTGVVTITVTFDRLDLRVTLTWDKGDGTDIDLHMFKGAVSTTVNPNYYTWRENGLPHVGWYTKIPNSFGSTVEQNPFLDIDNTRGYGPETIVLQEATNGTYHVWIHTYELPVSVGSTKATVQIYLGGEVYKFNRELVTHGSTWEVATITVPSGAVNSIDKLY